MENKKRKYQTSGCPKRVGAIFVSLLFISCSSASEFEPADRKEVRVLSDEDMAQGDAPENETQNPSDRGSSNARVDTGKRTDSDKTNERTGNVGKDSDSNSSPSDQAGQSGSDTLPVPPEDTGKPLETNPDPLTPKLQVRWSESDDPTIMKWNIYIRENSPYLAADRQLLEEVMNGQTLLDASDSYISLDIDTHPVLKNYVGKNICVLVTAVNEFGTSLHSKQNCLKSL